jgi:hypothetical protein
MRANLAELAAADAAADNNTAAAAASDQGSSSSNSDEAAASIGLSRSLRLSAPLRFALISCGGCHTLAVDGQSTGAEQLLCATSLVVLLICRGLRCADLNLSV